MSSTDLKGDALAMFTEHRDTIVAAGAIGIVVLFLLLFFGGFPVVGGLFFLGYALVWVTVLAVVLWLFYRLVTAIERIAAAQERLASTHPHETVSTAAQSATAEKPAEGNVEPAESNADDDDSPA